ncbi:MAG: phosphoglucosamine mutase [Fimbriimonadaceae bacterium]|nr:phosphoglucosamine mutase [Fimbriimonadaceae bacterium]
MSRKHFGTDGIRGIANEKLTPELAIALGQAAGRYVIARGLTPRVCVGRDTRRSGPMLGAALSAGFCSVGVDVVAVGVVPTGLISFAASRGDYGLGAVISASHNPAPDNGIKLLAATGRKLPDEDEVEIEGLMDEPPADRPTGAEIGLLESSRDSVDDYLAFLETLVPEGLSGLRVAVDGSNGAAHELGPQILRRLGAEVLTMGVDPDGANINEDCGATRPEAIQRFTVETGAQVGIAFDGDADRAVFSDEKGRLINGDRTIAAWAAHWHADPPVVVGTVMSNGGFAKYMESQGIRVERAPVGDKYVAQRIEATGAKIGGEQSGHLIFPTHAPTGDGLITALEFLRVLKRAGKAASLATDAYESWPQSLVNVRLGSTEGWREAPRVAEALAEADRKLGDRGRVVVRASGTQPVVRVMVEADAYALRDEVSESIVGALIAERDGNVYSRTDLTHSLGE